jgi:hypothetical protein
VIVARPSEPGVLQLSETVPLPAVGTASVGAPGAVAGVAGITARSFDFALSPNELTAETLS